jgi:hypothetical protein
MLPVRCGPGREAGPSLSPARDQNRFPAAPTPLGETAVGRPSDDDPVAVRRDC